MTMFLDKNVPMISMEMRPYRKRLILGTMLAAMITGFAAQNAGAGPIDWDKAQELREGVKLVKIDEMSSVDIVGSDKKTIEEARGVPYDGKREMKSYVMRVDLTLNGLKTTATGRDVDWGKPMPEDPKNRGKQIIRTKRQRTVDFMKEVAAREVEGRKAEVICGFNTAPWSPWPPPQHLYAVPSGVCISDGVDIKPTKAEDGAFFVIDRKGKCSITDKRPSDTNDVWIVHSGFAIIMKDGRDIDGGGYEKVLHPRMAAGLSRDGRYLYVVAVDGRKPGWSWGANIRDLQILFRDAGAYDAINFDGGGSASLCWWDPEQSAPVLINKTENRCVAVNLVFYR